MFKKWLVICLGLIFLMSHNAAALELGTTGLGAFQPTTNGDMGSYVVTSLQNQYGVCTSVSNSLNCALPGATVIQKFRLLSYNQIPAGSIVTFSYYLQGDGINSSFHGMSGGNNNTVLWQDFTALDGNTISGSVTLYVGTSTALIELGGYDGGVIGWTDGSLSTSELASFSMATWVTTSGSADYSQTLSAIANNTSGLADVIAYQAQTTRDLIYTQLNTVSTDLQSVIAYQQRVTREELAATIQTQVGRLLGELSDINDSTQNVSDYVDEQRQAYENMQDTDGLIDIGNQEQALSIIGALNGVLGNIKSIPASATCIISGNIGRLDLGDLNLCQGKENFGSIVAFVATTIFLFISFFIVLRIIRKILRVISWARSN